MSDQPDPREEQPMYTDSKGNLYRSKHEIPASELMVAFYQDLLGISQGFADDLTAAKERIAELEAALRELKESVIPGAYSDGKVAVDVVLLRAVFDVLDKS
jgi:hypothetical protein